MTSIAIPGDPVPPVLLNSGYSIPQLGFGVWLIDPAETTQRVVEALEVGYRHIDTAPVYGNESGVGQAIRAGGIPREDVFITSKLWNDQQHGDRPKESLLRSLDAMSLDYVDLYLVHWPTPARGTYTHAWEKLVELKNAGLARSIGVSNHEPEHLDRLVAATGVAPALNQVELHPAHQQPDVRYWAEKYGTQIGSWGPLGQGRYPLLDTPHIIQASQNHGKSPAQVVIRWHLQHGLVLTPKSSRRSRMIENLDVFDFQLTPAEMSEINMMHQPNGEGRLGEDPNTYNETWVPSR